MSTPSPSSSISTRRSLKIGIVGFGTFGQFLAKTMIKQGHILKATSVLSDHSQLCTHMGVQFFRDMGTFTESDNDVILLCTSILSLSSVVKSMPLQNLNRPTLFVDVLSVKEHPREVLLQVVPEESDILCTHPMFGPESGRESWKGLNFMYDRVRIRDEATCSAFLHIFQSEGCEMVEMTCEEHDKLAARSQFLTHIIGRRVAIPSELCHGWWTLSEMEIESTPIDTKNYQKLLQLKESTRESFDLFSGLFIYNRFANQQLKNLELALEKVKQKLVSRMNTELETSALVNHTEERHC